MSAKDGVTCDSCSSISHRECIENGIRVADVLSDKWRCADCQPKINIGQHLATQSHENDLPTAGNLTSAECETVSRDAVACIVVELRAQFENMMAELLLEFQSFKDEIRELRSIVGELKTDITAQKTDVAICTSNVSDLEKRTENLENYLSDQKNTVTVNELEQTVVGLKLALNDSEQEALLYDLELTGLPEQQGENLSHLVPLLATQIGVTLDEREVVSIERSGSQLLHKNTTSTAKPRRVVIRFSRRTTRDTCLRRAREARGLKSAELGPEDPPARLFLNERLTRLNRQLFAKAREACQHHKWRYCWTKGGRIYLREEEGLPANRIRTAEDLPKVFQST
ncbi:Zinc finger DNA binding protein [Operophtera brumata]|uniref:Zinc finger DNA binding protein n=1 Tax=Operophtera brumata TaxID=104452 RepID=A0A0L7L532_OPEBR|nr:Zinc finger DNA binding protein [Operophtera brumata]